eukprot:gene9100-10743_t
MIAVDQSQVEAEVNNFINYISPTNRSNEKRLQVVAFIRDILHKSALLEGYVIECGSSSLKSYLPESDLDLVLLAPCGKNSREEMQCLTAIFNSWCDEIADKEEGISTHYDMTIRNVEFVNARTKLAHCLVNNISVDVTVNQIGSLLTLTFLEEADRLVGMDHLFKNSLLLIKNWCYHESSYYCGMSIIGAKNGMLSSYAISVMVLHIFNKYSNLTHPFSVLRSFLYTYTSFPWDTHVLTIDGAHPLSSMPGAYYNNNNSSGMPSLQREHSDLHSISSLNSTGSGHSRRGSIATHTHSPGASAYSPDSPGRFQSILDALSQHPALALYQQAHSGAQHSRFTAKCCNIQDPVDNCNNLGISVPRHNLVLIAKACQAGFTHLETILRRYPNSLTNNNHNNQNATNGFVSHTNNHHIVNNSSHNETVEFGFAQAGDVNNNQKSNFKVKQMLQPVPPGNLGYTGTAAPALLPTQAVNNVNNGSISAVDSSNNNNNMNNKNGPYFHTGDLNEGAQPTEMINSTNTPYNINPANVPTIPNRRNSRTTSSGIAVHPGNAAYSNNNAFKLPFLAEFFPTSLSLYCSPEGEPLRCDLLNHPLQPLSTSSLLANPHYNNHNTDHYSVNGANRSRGVSSANVFTDNVDGMSVTSHTSQTSATFANQSNNYPADPLLGDLRGMYEALDLYVSSRRVPNVAKSISSSVKRTPNSAQSSVAGSVQSALSLSPLPLTLPLPMALPISLPLSLPSLDISRYISPSSKIRTNSSAATQVTPASSTHHSNTLTPSTVATSSGMVKYTPAVPLSPARHRSPVKLSSSNLPTTTSSAKKTRNVSGPGVIHSSPTGSTTSGTTSDSPRQRVSISISSDSDTEPEGPEEACQDVNGASNNIRSHRRSRRERRDFDSRSGSGSESEGDNREDDEGLRQSSSARKNMRSVSGKLNLETHSSENFDQPSNTAVEANGNTDTTSGKSAVIGPIGSIMAFFQPQTVYHFCTELPTVVSQRLAALQLTTVTVNAAFDTSAANNSTVARSSSGNGGANEQTNSTTNKSALSGGAQKGAVNPKRATNATSSSKNNNNNNKVTPPPTHSSTTLNNNKNNVTLNKNVAMAAAARRNNKRDVTSDLKKLYEVILAYIQLRAEQGVALCKRLLTTSPLLQRQLIVALVYCIFMIFTINKVLNSSSTYSQYWRLSVTHSVQYLHNMRTFPQWLHQTLYSTTRNNNNNYMDSSAYDEHEYSQYDFFAPAEAAPVGGFGAAAHSSYAHMFPSSRAKLITDPDTMSADRYAVRSTIQSALNIATHWVKEGDSISFGDFGTYTPKPYTLSTSEEDGDNNGSSNHEEKGATSSDRADNSSKPSAAPATAPSTTPTSASASTYTASSIGASASNKNASSAASNTAATRVTASTTTSASSASTARAPSEYVQKTQYVPKSEYVLASSSVVGAPYIYQWTKDGVNISNTLYTSQPYFSIKKARMEDAGHYRCMRYDAQVSHRAPVLVMETVLQISKPPTVALRPSHHEVKAGTTMFLNLAAEGTPPPVFQWYRNGYLVPGLTGMALLMEDVNSSHSGTYSCDVQNIAGGFVWLEASVLVVD